METEEREMKKRAFFWRPAYILTSVGVLSKPGRGRAQKWVRKRSPVAFQIHPSSWDKLLFMPSKYLFGGSWNESTIKLKCNRRRLEATLFCGLHGLHFSSITIFMR